MDNLKEQLENMDDPNTMWNLFTDKMNYAWSKFIPTKTIRGKTERWPEWMNRPTMKLVEKQRKTWMKYKKTGDRFHLVIYRRERKESRISCKSQKKNYIINRVCKPLENRNAKPFYIHLQQIKGKEKPRFKLKTDHGTVSEDPILCAEMLNNYFKEQFGPIHQNQSEHMPIIKTNNIEISSPGIEKLIRTLKNGKSPGPDGLRKEDLLVDCTATSCCLKEIFQASLKAGRLPNQWKLLV